MGRRTGNAASFRMIFRSTGKIAGRFSMRTVLPGSLKARAQCRLSPVRDAPRRRDHLRRSNRQARRCCGSSAPRAGNGPRALQLWRRRRLGRPPGRPGARGPPHATTYPVTMAPLDREADRSDSLLPGSDIRQIRPTLSIRYPAAGHFSAAIAQGRIPILQVKLLDLSI